MASASAVALPLEWYLGKTMLNHESNHLQTFLSHQLIAVKPDLNYWKDSSSAKNKP